eukprot:NODE_1048_length_2154_cov_35.111768_g894_i0.p1 GENE.NODE_1048_length_2154_cov_35.111768_g894_i0~~NODE_1048_length_2154_cov_35.111768_g894_i0.p1  ORF type:complete len:557 (-),score=139.99 NODE_1048_length_2154_cov_35.111768_g894_i0:484-2076(-)
MYFSREDLSKILPLGPTVKLHNRISKEKGYSGQSNKPSSPVVNLLTTITKSSSAPPTWNDPRTKDEGMGRSSINPPLYSTSTPSSSMNPTLSMLYSSVKNETTRRDKYYDDQGNNYQNDYRRRQDYKNDFEDGNYKNDDYNDRYNSYSQDDSKNQGNDKGWTCTGCHKPNYASRRQCYKCNEPRRPDAPLKELPSWTCWKCRSTNNNMNSSSCFKCSAARSLTNEDKSTKFREGWACDKCHTINNDSRVNTCYKCHNPRSEASYQDQSKGWTCQTCHLEGNMGRTCNRCGKSGNSQDPPPSRRQNQGGWRCPECEITIFYPKIRCVKCKKDKPEQADEVPPRPPNWQNPRTDNKTSNWGPGTKSEFHNDEIYNNWQSGGMRDREHMDHDHRQERMQQKRYPYNRDRRDDRDGGRNYYQQNYQQRDRYGGNERSGGGGGRYKQTYKQHNYETNQQSYDDNTQDQTKHEVGGGWGNPQEKSASGWNSGDKEETQDAPPEVEPTTSGWGQPADSPPTGAAWGGKQEEEVEQTN